MCDYCHNDASFEWVKDFNTVKTCKMTVCHDAAKEALGDDYDVYDLD